MKTNEKIVKVMRLFFFEGHTIFLHSTYGFCEQAPMCPIKAQRGSNRHKGACGTEARLKERETTENRAKNGNTHNIAISAIPLLGTDLYRVYLAPWSF